MPFEHPRKAGKNSAALDLAEVGRCRATGQLLLGTAFCTLANAVFIALEANYAKTSHDPRHTGIGTLLAIAAISVPASLLTAFVVAKLYQCTGFNPGERLKMGNCLAYFCREIKSAHAAHYAATTFAVALPMALVSTFAFTPVACAAANVTCPASNLKYFWGHILGAVGSLATGVLAARRHPKYSMPAKELEIGFLEEPVLDPEFGGK